MDAHPLPLSERLRPKSLEEFILPERLRTVLNRFIESGTIMNLTFYGRAGIGKTSAARLLGQHFYVYEVNGSHNKGDKTAVNKIKDFASAMSLDGKRKLCVIDEADAMSASMQDSLRYEIENYNNCRFLLTANDIDRITEPMQSRCLPVSFDLTPKDRKEMRPHVIGAYEQKLVSVGVQYESGRLTQIIDAYFPDYRAIAGRIEYEFGLPEQIEALS
jgi:DNA polymerase III delta prime subunit